MIEDPPDAPKNRGDSDIPPFVAQIGDFTAQATAVLHRWDHAAPPDGGEGVESQNLLHAAVEELRVAAEELVEQHEALVSSQRAMLAERRYRDLFEFAPDGYFVTNRSAIVQQANRAATQLLGVPAANLAGKPLAAFVAPSTHHDFYRFLAQIPHGSTPSSCSLRFRRSGRVEFPALLTVAEHAIGPEQPGLLWLLRDLTDREQMSQSLDSSRQQTRQLAQRLIRIHEAERSRIAGELQDGVGQSLTALSLGLGELARGCSGDLAATAQIDRLKQMANEIMLGLHSLAVSLRPASLDRLGLPQAVRQLANTYGQNGSPHIAVQVVSLDGVHLAPAVETALYRIVQEALTNASRHARAQDVGIILQRLDGQALAIVEDEGSGFDVEQALASGGIGLLGMRERCEMLGGTLSIESVPGKGTAIYAQVPIDLADAL